MASNKRKPTAEAHSRLKASWIFGTLLLVFFIYVFVFSPDTLPEYKQRILAFFSALIAGLFGYFLTGDIGLEIHSGQSRFGNLSIKATAGFAAFVLMLWWWYSPLAPVKAGPKPIVSDPAVTYQVRVTVLDPQQVPVNDAALTSSVGGEQKKVNGTWEFDIPATSKPADGKVTIYAAKQSELLYGSEEVTLSEDFGPVIKIQLVKNATPPPRNSNSSGHSPPPASFSSYKVHVTARDSERNLVEDVEIYPTPAGVRKKVEGGWEIEISAADRPANGLLKIYAAKPNAFLNGEATVRLDTNPNPTVEILMQRDTSARIKGKVIDSSSQPLVGAWVNVIGYEGERVQTGPSGEFDLPAHATKGQLVKLHAQMEGYAPEDQRQPAGTIPMTIILRKR